MICVGLIREAGDAPNPFKAGGRVGLGLPPSSDALLQSGKG